MKLIIGLLLPLLIIVSFSSALHSEEYLRSLTNKISQECGSNDYSIKEGILFNGRGGQNDAVYRENDGCDTPGVGSRGDGCKRPQNQSASRRRRNCDCRSGVVHRVKRRGTGNHGLPVGALRAGDKHRV